jgi:hypothetical protein
LGTITQLRGKIIYVNDYNTAVRYDRLMGHDPVDEWQNEHYQNSAGTGGYWLAAPVYNGEKVEKEEDKLDKDGRLVASGNNHIYVWQASEPERLEYSVITGEKIQRS